MKFSEHNDAAIRRSLPLSLTILVLAAVFPLSAGISFGQEKALAGDEAAAELRKARRILTDSAATQGGEEIVADLRNFRAFFKLEVFDAEKGRGNFDVQRLFVAGGDLDKMWTRKRHDGSKSKWSTIVWDGFDGWRIAEKDGKNELTIFTDRPSAFKTDLRNIDADVRLTGQMFHFFFVQTLLDRVPDMRYVRESRVGDEPVHILEGRISAWLGEDEKTVVLLKIAMSRKDNRILEIRLIDLARDGKRRMFRFDKYRRNSQGVLVPNLIRIYGEDEKKQTMQISLDVDISEKKNSEGRTVRQVIPKIAFNVTVPEKLFEIPKPEKK